MDLTTITVDDFKALFFRDFPYFSSIQYDPTAVYNTGDEVFFPATNLFYQCNTDVTQGVAPYPPPAAPATSPWTKYQDDSDNWVQDADITKAFSEAQICFNQTFFNTDPNIQIGYLYMTAHYLVIDLRAAMAGGINASGDFPLASRTVGSVSAGYAVPAAYTENPQLSQYTTTAYGMKYLTMVLPQMVGNIVAVWGGARP